MCLSPGGKALPNTRAPSLAKGYGSTSLNPPCPESLTPDCEERSCPFRAGCADLCLSGQFDGMHIVSGSLDTSIRVWDVESGNCLHTLMGHQSLTSGMELRDNILVSGNADSTVKIWDIKTGQCLQTLQGVYGRMERPRSLGELERGCVAPGCQAWQGLGRCCPAVGAPPEPGAGGGGAGGLAGRGGGMGRLMDTLCLQGPASTRVL